MSKYAKKKMTEKVRLKKRVAKQPLEQINMKPSKKNNSVREPRPSNSKNSSFLRVRSFMISAAILVVFLGAYLVLHLLHPVGVLEYISNSLATIGGGKYPVSLHGGDTLQVDRQNGTCFVLSKTNVDIFNNSGKLIFSSQHGFLQPVLKTSDVRYLIYDQGGKGIKIYNNNKSLVTKKYDNEIISAVIGKNGTYAVATRADGYQSLVSVTNKNEKKLYDWYCVDETVNSLALSDNGQILLTASMRVDNGKLKTTVNVLKYDSAAPVFSYEFDDVVLSTEISGNNKGVIAFSDRLIFIDLKKGNTASSSSNYDIDIFKRFDNFILTCSSFAANKQETQITLYRFNGEIIDSFNFSSAVDDISYFKGKYFILSDSVIYKLDKNGIVLASEECSFDINRLIAVSGDSTVGVGYSKIDKYSLAGG